MFVVGSTAAMTTIEFEPGAISDFNGLLDRLAPRRCGLPASSAVGRRQRLQPRPRRACSVHPSRSRSSTARCSLGTWQQIMLLEVDTRPREREIVVQMIA